MHESPQQNMFGIGLDQKKILVSIDRNDTVINIRCTYCNITKKISNQSAHPSLPLLLSLHLTRLQEPGCLSPPSSSSNEFMQGKQTASASNEADRLMRLCERCMRPFPELEHDPVLVVVLVASWLCLPMLPSDHFCAKAQMKKLECSKLRLTSCSLQTEKPVDHNKIPSSSRLHCVCFRCVCVCVIEIPGVCSTGALN